MKKLIKFQMPLLILLLGIATFSFQSCDSKAVEKNDASVSPQLRATEGTSICDVSLSPMGGCESSKCICPTYFEIHEIEGESSYISFRRIEGSVSPLCYDLSEPGVYCLELTGGGYNESTATTYQVVLNGLVSESPSAVISLSGSCHTNFELTEHEMDYSDLSTSNLLFKQWACHSETADPVDF